MTSIHMQIRPSLLPPAHGTRAKSLDLENGYIVVPPPAEKWLHIYMYVVDLTTHAPIEI